MDIIQIFLLGAFRDGDISSGHGEGAGIACALGVMSKPLIIAKQSNPFPSASK